MSEGLVRLTGRYIISAFVESGLEPVDEQPKQSAFSGAALAGHYADTTCLDQQFGRTHILFDRREREQLFCVDLAGKRVGCEIEIAEILAMSHHLDPLHLQAPTEEK